MILDDLKHFQDRNDSFYTRRLKMVDVGSWFRFMLVIIVN
jgi:hypothetical protein